MSEFYPFFMYPVRNLNDKDYIADFCQNYMHLCPYEYNFNFRIPQLVFY